MITRRMFSLGLLGMLALAGCTSTTDQPSFSASSSQLALNRGEEPIVEFRPVAMAKTEEMLALFVNGKVITIQGAGGANQDRPFGGFTPFSSPYSFMNDLARAGANCYRLYGTSYSFTANTDNHFAAQVNDVKQALTFAQTVKPQTFYVLVGLVMTNHVAGGSGATGNGVDYTNAAQVKAQEDLVVGTAQQVVQQLQGTGLRQNQLGWCIGNEILDGDANIQNAMWQSIDRIAVRLKGSEVGTQLPIMTAHNTVTVARLGLMNAAMPHLDWLGINDYTGVFSTQPAQSGGFLWQLPETMATALQQGVWTKPWLVTEFASYDLKGLNIPQSGEYTLEVNSTDNARNFSNSWKQYIVSSQAQMANCCGGFALNWCQSIDSDMPAHYLFQYAFRGAPTYKDFTAVWNAALADRLACTDALATAWGGQVSTTPCPQIIVTDGDPQGIATATPFKVTSSSQPAAVAPGTALQASVTVAAAPGTDPTKLTFDWYLVGGSTFSSPAHNINAASNNPQAYSSTSLYLGSGASATPSGTQVTNTVIFTAPAGAPAGNVYQLRVVARDNLGGPSTSGGAATAAITFRM